VVVEVVARSCRLNDRRRVLSVVFSMEVASYGSP